MLKNNDYYHIKSLFNYNSKINPLTKTELNNYLIKYNLL